MLNSKDLEILRREFIDKFNFSDEDKKLIEEKCIDKILGKDKLTYFNHECLGFIIVKSGLLRAFITSENFKEITVFMLKKGESCVLCDSCFMGRIETKINIQVKEQAEVLLIPAEIFIKMKDKYQSLTNHILTLVAKRFAQSIKVMEQALFSPLSERILAFLKKNSQNGSMKITHEELASHLGSAREAVSRILKEMENDKLISRKRGVITIL